MWAGSSATMLSIPCSAASAATVWTRRAISSLVGNKLCVSAK